MREAVDLARVRRVMEAFGRKTNTAVRIYFVGGVTAVLNGWRSSTVDIDFVMNPESESLLRAIPELKEHLNINVELAAPIHFIPVPSGWEDRSPFIQKAGLAEFYHFDLYAQALAKVERGHARDLTDVQAMLDRQLVNPADAMIYFAKIEPDLFRYPAIDPVVFRRQVEAFFCR